MMSPLKPPLLTAELLVCQRSDRQLFQAISFSIAAGEVLQITGPNGVGKSSLLRILSGLLPLASGKLNCSGDRFFIGHQLGLKKAFTVAENLRFDFRYPEPDNGTIGALLQEVGLINCFSKQTVELSQGQQQRLALSKLLLSKSSVWLLDEPFVALDAEARIFWSKKIAAHLQQGGAAIISSHLPLSIPDACLEQLELTPC